MNTIQPGEACSDLLDVRESYRGLANIVCKEDALDQLPVEDSYVVTRGLAGTMS